MVELKVNGLVIREINLDSTDKMFTLLTDEFGRMNVVAKGVKNVRSHFLSSTQLFTYATFILVRLKDYYYINDCTVIENNYDIRLDFKKLALSTYICDVLYEVSRENLKEENVLKLGLNTLYAIAKDVKELSIIKASFEFKIACEIGYRPDLIKCRNCGEENPENSYIKVLDGFFLCEKCNSMIQNTTDIVDNNLQNIFYMSFSMLCALRYLAYCKISRFLSYNLEDSEQVIFCNFCEKYLLSHIEQDFGTLEFYKSL